MKAKCKSKLFQDYTFTLNDRILRAKRIGSKTDIQLKTGDKSADYFTILNLYTNTPTGNAWIKKQFNPDIIAEFWSDIEWLNETINAFGV